MMEGRKAELEARISKLLKGSKKPRFGLGNEKLEIPKPMRLSLETFDEFNRQRKLSPATRANQLDPLLDFGLFLQHRRGKNRYEEAAEEDFVSYQADVPMPKSVAQLNFTVLRKFYWILEGKQRQGRTKIYPAKVEALEPPQKGENEEFNPEKVPYYREMARHVEALVRAMDHPRDRAIIAFTFDTGARLEEAANLSIGSLSLDREYGTVSLHGKTGTRDVTFVRALPYLTTWLNMHPTPSDQKSHLWIALGGGHEGESLKYSTVADVFFRAAKRTRLPLSAHDMRHGRATETAQLNWTEAKMRQFFGWRPGSAMPSTYIHLASADTKDQVLSDAGIQSKEKSETRGMPTRCPNCGRMNESVNVVCGVCRFPLTADELAQGATNQLADFADTLSDVFEIFSDRLSEAVGFLSPDARKEFEAGRPEAEEKIAGVMRRAGFLGEDRGLARD